MGLLSYAYGIISGDYLTRSKYLELTGAQLSPDLYEAPKYKPLGEPEQRDGYTRQKVRVRLFSDEQVKQRHPEIERLVGTESLMPILKQVQNVLFTKNIESSFGTNYEVYEDIVEGARHISPDAVEQALVAFSFLSEDVQYSGVPYSLSDVRVVIEEIKQAHAQMSSYGARSSISPSDEEFTKRNNRLREGYYKLAEMVRIPNVFKDFENLYRDTLRFYTHTEAYVLTPNDMMFGEKRPAILVQHQHNAEYGLGKSEPAGVTAGGAPNQATALDLVYQGYVVVTYDQPGFESRQHPVRTGLQWERWRSHGLEQQGKSLLGMQLEEAVKMVSFVESLPNVDKNKIGAYGHSLGSWMTANLAAVDNRIKVAVANCGFPTIKGLNTLPAQYHCEPHGIPGLGKYGFDFPSLFDVRNTNLRLHMNFGGSDALNSEHGIVTRGVRAIAERWGLIKFSSFVDPLVVHKNTPAMLERTLETFTKGFEALGYKPTLESHRALEVK